MERDDCWNEDEADDGDGEDGEDSLGSAVVVEAMADTWLATASRYRLLTAEEEVRIGRGQRVCGCCRDGTEALVNHNLRLVVSVAKRYRIAATHAVGREDLWQAGAMGLMTAAQKWDWTHGAKFSTYATWWIRQTISRWLADYGWTVREPAYRQARRNAAIRAGEDFEAMLLPVSLDVRAVRHDSESDFLVDVLPDQSAPDPLEAVVAADEREQLFALMRTVLRPREAVILALRFGLAEEAAGEGMTLQQVGQMLGITRERVRQVEADALQKLRDASEKNALGLRKPAAKVYYEQSAKNAPAAAGVWTPRTGPLTDRQTRWDQWYAEHRDEHNARRNAKRREQRQQHRVAGPQQQAAALPAPDTPSPTQPAKTRPRQTRRPAPSVSSPATGRETREPHVSQQSAVVAVATKRSRRRAPSQSTPHVEVEPMMSLVVDAQPASCATAVGVSGGKRTTTTDKLTRGRKKQAKNSATKRRSA